MPERIAIVGARQHPNLDLVREYVRGLPKETVVLTGGADGVDEAAFAAAIEVGLEVVVYEPSDRQVAVTRAVPYGAGHTFGQEQRRIVRGYRDALLLRNTLLPIDCTRMTVFPDGSKGGCWDAAREAVRFRRPVEVHWCSGKVEPFGKSKQRRT